MSIAISNEWLGAMIMFAVCALLLGPLFWSLYNAKKRLSADTNGWVETRRSIFDHVIGIIQIGFSVVWLVFGTLSPFFLKEPNIGAVIIFILMLVMGVWFLQSFLFVYCASVRFNDAKLEYKAIGKKISVYWSGVESIKMGQNGPKITTVEGSFSISNLRRGFYQLLEKARENNVEIQNSPHLKTSG
ncbi:hypothetical protein [Hyphococcus sp.]|jgi:hypothetical protein|uniref:hypothetical protein n=1 Tax=Hyphococcus sp. TaxID=2038636 RepID=UPI003D103B07